MKYIEDQSIDAILADLPFGKTKANWDKKIDLPLLWEQYKRIIKEDGVILLFATSPFDKKLWASNPKWYRYDWVWRKNKPKGHLNAKRMPMQTHELISVFYKKPPLYNPQMTTGHKPMNKATTKHTSDLFGGGKPTPNQAGTTKRYPQSVLNFKVVNNDDSRRIHSTQKPVELLRYFIRTYTREGELVLDNVCGSGSLGVAAIEENRDFILMEKVEETYNLAKAVIDAKLKTI